MNAALAGVRSSTHCSWSLVLLWVGATVLHSPARAQSGVPSLPAPANQPAEKQPDPYWWADRFDKVRLTNPSTTSHIFLSDPRKALPTPSPVFFPPVPPPLGVDFPVLGRLVPGATPAPTELAAYVSELFYPLLGSRLVAGDLSKSLWQQIQSYRTARTDLQNELRTRIAELKDTELPARARQLAALAAAQAPRIDSLEATAEKIHADLQPTGLFGFRPGPDPLRDEAGRRPAEGSGGPDPLDAAFESGLLRRAAFYERGLSSAQRHLLLEGAIELEARPATTPAPTGKPGEGRLLHFSPETARITVPAGLSDPLEKLIHDYVAEKNGLKAEILDVLLSHEPASEAGAQALKELAATQASRLAGLEITAEEIRRGLAPLPNPPGPPSPPALPPELMARISAYRRHKVELLKTLHGMLAGGRENAGDARGGDPLGTNGGTRAAPGNPMSRQESVAEFNRRQTVLIGELNRETAGIREALAEYVRTTGQSADRKSIDDLLLDFENARQKQEVWDKYRDYQVAVLMPGLSPGQRRLLFDAAVEQLALPLPPGNLVH